MISSGAWTLFRANALCLMRRLRPVARSSPLLALLAPAVPLLVYAVLAGVGFLVEGGAALVGAFAGHPGSSRLPTVVSGLLSIIGGVVVLVAPGLALTVFTVFSGIALVVVGAAALLLLPPRAAVRHQAVDAGAPGRR